MMFFKQLIQISVLFSLIFYLTGCAAADQKVLKLTLWHGINPPENRIVFKELISKFNQVNTNFQVEDFYVGQADQQIPKILTAIVGNQPPDILWYAPQITSQLVELGAIVPLESWLNKSGYKGKIETAIFEGMELNNHIYSIPFATNNTAIFYRPSLFKKAGINSLPKTWDDFKTVAKQLTKDKQHGLILPLGKGEWTVFTWLPFIYSAGGEIVENNEVNLVNQGTIKALELGAELLTNGSAILSAPERGYEIDSFLSGEVAMQITGPWTLGQLKQTKVDYDVFPIPQLERPAAVVGGENLFLFKTTPTREKAAKQFFEYVISEEFQLEWALKTGYLPINIKVKESQAYKKFVEENPALKVFLEQMKWARSRPLILGYINLSENLGRAIEATFLKRKTAKEALEESQKRLDLIGVK